MKILFFLQSQSQTSLTTQNPNLTNSGRMVTHKFVLPNKAQWRGQIFVCVWNYLLKASISCNLFYYNVATGHYRLYK